MRAFVSYIALAAALAASAQAQEAGSQEPVLVGMSGGYVPFTFVEQDQLQGFEVDFMNAVGEEIGRPVEFVTMSFSGLIGALESGRIDTVANQITITPEREEAFVFTQAYVIDGAQIVVQEGNTEISGPEDLRGRSVAVNLGSNFEQLLRELPYADEIDIRTYESNIEQDTALGRVDAFVMDRVSSAVTIQERDMPLQLAGEPFSEIRNALPFRDDEEGRALRDEVDAAITTLIADGTLSEISEHWLGLDVTPAAAGKTETEGEGAVEQEDPAADADAVAPDEAAAGVVDPAGDAGVGLEPSDDAGADAVEQEDPAADADAVAPDEAAAGVVEPAGDAAAGLEPGDEGGDCTDVVEQEDPAADADAVAPDEAAAGVLEPSGDASAGLEPGDDACAEVVEREDPAADADEVSPDEAAAGVLEPSGEAGGGLEPGNEASTEPAATE